MKLNIPVYKIHDALAFASLYIGEGATMASECAMLGTPAIYVNSLAAGTIEEQASYGLLLSFRSTKGVTEKTLELLKNPQLREDFQIKRNNMLSRKIDLTNFFIELLTLYCEKGLYCLINELLKGTSKN